jgi:hypothetical protein
MSKVRMWKGKDEGSSALTPTRSVATQSLEPSPMYQAGLRAALTPLPAIRRTASRPSSILSPCCWWWPPPVMAGRMCDLCLLCTASKAKQSWSPRAAHPLVALCATKFQFQSLKRRGRRSLERRWRHGVAVISGCCSCSGIAAGRLACCCCVKLPGRW